MYDFFSLHYFSPPEFAPRFCCFSSSSLGRSVRPEVGFLICHCLMSYCRLHALYIDFPLFLGGLRISYWKPTSTCRRACCVTRRYNLEDPRISTKGHHNNNVIRTLGQSERKETKMLHFIFSVLLLLAGAELIADVRGSS